MRRLATIVAIWALASVVGWAQAENFYEGKKVRLIVSSSPGGGNDTYSRLIARHIPKHIPGNPTFIVQNISGAGGLRGADYLYRKAPRDGTVMGQINWGVWNWQLLDDPRAKFDFTKMNAIGVAAIESAIIYTRMDRYKDWDSVLAAKKLITNGGSGPNSLGHTMGRVLEKLLGKRIFEYVLGYPGAREYSLAFRQGEVDSSGNTPGSFADQLGDMWKAGEIAMLFQAPTLEGKRTKDFPNTPTLLELAKDKRQRDIVNGTFLLTHYGRPYTFPPGVPSDRVKIMREAFTETMQDPQFLSEAKRLGRIIIPSTGEELQKLWLDTFNAPEEQKDLNREIFGKRKS